nr:RecName: Full=22 kDa cell wall protein [Solanum lycopersicum]
MNIPPGD